MDISPYLSVMIVETELILAKGIGKGTVEGLSALGITSITDLVNANPEDLSSKLSGASSAPSCYIYFR
ncbi:hypothetical protein LCGC14_1391380 [marine sediment metagenome]|uniref:DUF4332 domain-containing protein n=1 Tax=marine sediment metagenome TaxID=412755 RepID=A0A0F9KKP8_9ZZZZ|nr:MAG: hypothetical protein Lokiarch_07810 [Candidatus Lokiarchaeum sp. GC14_75]